MLENLPEVLGHTLRDRRAGLEKLAFNVSGLRVGMGTLRLSSLAFADHAPLPADYTADGAGVSPPLQWSGVPSGADSLVLIVEDADSPTPQPLVHAIVVDLPAGDGALSAGALQSPDHLADAGVQVGRNSLLQAGWLPPDPPPGHGVHRYAFQLFALGPSGEPFAGTPGRTAVMAAIRERALASGCLIGTYARPDGSVSDGTTPVPIAPQLPVGG